MKNQFNNVGFAIDTLPPEIFQKVRDEIKNFMTDIKDAVPMNRRLAGHLRSEYELNDSFQFLRTFMEEAVNNHNKEVGFTSHQLEVDELWINFQKSGEFNPIHIHTGVFSFVIWVQIPYKIEDELALFNVKNPRTSCFEFVYINSLGKISSHTLRLGTEDEGKFAIFPSELNHCVHPFYTTEDLRISISGNLNFIKGVINESARSLP